MPEALVDFATAVAGWLSTWLLHSTVLIAATWLLTRSIALQPRSRVLLWRFALLGGLVTAAGAVARGPDLVELRLVRRVVETEVRTEPLEWQTPAEPSAARQRFEARLGAVSPACRASLRAALPPLADDLPRIREACGDPSGPPWSALVVLAWLLGAAIGLASVAADVRALRALRSSLRPAGPRLVRALGAVACGRARVRAMTSPLLAGPCALGDGTIGLPERCALELDDAELKAALAHEVAHVERRDPIWALLLRAVVVVTWMQPLNRLALRRALEAAEEACDDWALARTGERRGLASSISRVATWVAAAPEARLAAPMAGRGGTAPSSRVRRILAGPVRHEPAWVRFAAVGVVAAPLLFVPPVRAPAPERTAIVVEERGVLAPVAPDGAAVAGDLQATTVFVARIRTD